MMISVVIPCRNEVKNIAECVEAIFASELQAGDSMEVLVVDGMSNDGTLKVLEELQQQFEGLKIVPNPQQVTPVAFNLGIKAASGEFLQIIGARQVVSSNYLREAKRALMGNPEIGVVGGAMINVYENEESERISLAMSSSFGVGGGSFRTLKKSGFTDTVGTPMYRRSIFDEIGYFNESLHRNQDDELNYRVIKHGQKNWLNADITIKYYVRASIRNLFKQYYQYGYWKVYVNKLHGAITNMRQLAPAVFVLGLILGFLLSWLHPLLAWMYVGALALYVLLALYAAFAVSGVGMRAFRVALIFPVLHFSYGWGYVRGLIDFFILRKNPSRQASELSR